MNFDSFFNRMAELNVEIEIDKAASCSPHYLNNEALFQLPFISLIILLMAKDKRKPKTSEIGQLVGECIELGMPSFKGSSQHVGWSANLRIRTVKALGFLELANLVDVNNRKERIEITDLGKKIIHKAINQDDNLSYNLSVLSREYRNICVSRQLDLELE